MTDMCDINGYEKTNTEVNLIYQMLIDGIKQTKNQIWLTMYYVLLVYGAIIGFYSLLTVKQCGCFLIICALLACVAGLVLIAHYNNLLLDYRGRIDNRIKPKLSEKARNILDNNVTTRWDNFDIIFYIGCTIMFLIGFVFAVWFIKYN
jgi:hypothetical protein